MNTLFAAIEKKDWKLISAQFTPDHIAVALPFKKAMNLAHVMLLNDERDDEIRAYSVQLLKHIRATHQEEWNADWRNDKFLGDACYLVMDYDEKYAAYERAYKKTKDAPASLLLALAGCYISPGGSISITLEEAEDLVKRALRKDISVKAVILMRGICSQKNDVIGVTHWNRVLQDIDNKNIPISNDWPDFT